MVVAAVDATTDGGNLLARTGVSAVDPAHSIPGFDSRMALSSSGLVVVGSGQHGHSTDPAIVDLVLANRHSARIFDVGAAMTSPRLAALLRSGAALVVVAPARSEPLSRMREALGWLTDSYGTDTLAHAIVVVSHQFPASVVDIAPIRAALAAHTAGLVEVPFDPELARPGVLDHRRLSPSTVDAWTDVLDLLGEHHRNLGSARSSSTGGGRA